MVPVVDVFFCLFDEFEFLFWVVDECAEFPFLAFPDFVTEEFVDFALDVSGRVFEYVLEGWEGSMKVGEEVFCPFGQIEYGL